MRGRAGPAAALLAALRPAAGGRDGLSCYKGNRSDGAACATAGDARVDGAVLAAGDASAAAAFAAFGHPTRALSGAGGASDAACRRRLGRALLLRPFASASRNLCHWLYDFAAPAAAVAAAAGLLRRGAPAPAVALGAPGSALGALPSKLGLGAVAAALFAV
eukprot:gene1197-58438_t